MATTLPTLTQRIDDAFVSTWYEIRAQAIDNILSSNVITAALREKGVFTPQVGGKFITRTILHGKTTTKDVAKGDVFSQGEPELKTMARWDWRYISAHVQRSLFDDQQNSGAFQIASLVKDRIKAARDALNESYEEDLIADFSATAETTSKAIQGLVEMVPLEANRLSNTYGHINRPTAYTSSADGIVEVASTGNTWWGPKYLDGLEPAEVNLVSEMKKLYNSLHNNQEPPDLIISDQSLFEIYEDFALDASQIIKEGGSQLADLGFEVLRFKGKPMVWSSAMTASHMFMLTTAYIEWVFDPMLWFSMTDWKPIALQGERIAHILSASNLICSQMRRQGRLYFDG